MPATQLTSQQQTEVSGTHGQDKLQESNLKPSASVLSAQGIEGAGACTISLAIGGWKQDGPRLPRSSSISSAPGSIAPRVSSAGITQACTDIMCIIQEKLQQVTKSPSSLPP